MSTLCRCRMCGGEHEHWGEDSTYPVSDWQEEVGRDDTRLGYWDWVRGQQEDTDE